MNILAYVAKRALRDAIDTLLASPTVQVSYAAPGDLTGASVYLGGMRGVQSDAVAETGVATDETVLIDVVVRVFLPGDDGEAADAAVELLADQIIGFLAANPALAGGLSIAGVQAYDAPMPEFTASPEATVTAQLNLRVSVQGVF